LKQGLLHLPFHDAQLVAEAEVVSKELGRPKNLSPVNAISADQPHFFKFLEVAVDVGTSNL
jgi:hypothetical protein